MRYNTITSNGTLGVYTADGNSNDKTMWPEHSENGNHNVIWFIPNATYVVYTRYPG